MIENKILKRVPIRVLKKVLIRVPKKVPIRVLKKGPNPSPKKGPDPSSKYSFEGLDVEIMSPSPRIEPKELCCELKRPFLFRSKSFFSKKIYLDQMRMTLIWGVPAPLLEKMSKREEGKRMCQLFLIL